MKAIFKFIALFTLVFCCANVMQAFEGNCVHMYAFDEQSFDNQHIDKIITNEQGVFLLIDGCWIGTQGVHVTQDGMFVLENGEWISLFEARGRSNNYVWQCPICKTWNVQNGQPCSNSANHPK